MKSVNAYIHRFGDKVALSFIGADGETVYLDKDQAEQLAKAMLECCKEIGEIKFSQSNFNSRKIGPNPN